MENKRDYYDILGLEKNADAKAIKDSFRKLALKYHPDRNKEPQAQEKFKEITEAYAILSDPKKRQEYDKRGFVGVANFSQEDLFSGINFDEIFGGAMGLDLGNFGGDLFDSFFTKRHHRDNRGEDIRVEVTVPFQKILTGGEEEVKVSHLRLCTECGGNGNAKGSEARICTLCHGAGHLTNIRKEGNVSVQESRTCPDCMGAGSFIDNPCPECHGRGSIDYPEKLLVKIPIGAEEGMILKIPEHGLPSHEKGGKVGDLLVILRSADDPYFSRIGADLWHTETIEVLDAVLGTDIEVSTFEEALKVHIPEGVQHDTILRISKKGLPYLGDTKRGDLYIRINLHIPETISDKERLLYERLRSIAKESHKETWVR